MTPASPAAVSHWDAIVVGAGPAGSALARRLAPRCRVLLLERAPSSAVPVNPMAWRIGESLPGAAAVLLRRQGLLDRFLADGHAERGASVSAWDNEAPAWFDLLRDPHGPGWHLDRLRFDQMLRGAAGEAGAVFRLLRGRFQVLRNADDGWCVHDSGSGERHTAAVLVDATGRNAALCRTLGLRRYDEDRLVCLHALLPPSPGFDRCTRTAADQDGWWYSVRVPSGQRVLAFHLDADDPALRGLRDVQALLARARHVPVLREVLPEKVEPAATHVRPAGSAALDLPACKTWPGLYAVGDAVLAFDPISSQGLFHALASAESAAAAITRYLGGDAAAGQRYATEMQAVQARYRAHLAATYAGPKRYRQRPFWARRCELDMRLNLGAGEPVAQP